MTILLAPDKFKGSLSAAEVCDALAKGLLQRYPEAQILSCPLADGGDGSLDVLAAYYELQTISKEVSDPLGRPVKAAYQLAGDTAYVELAAASGIALLPTSALNTMDASTLGTGQLIADALDRGIQSLYLFIGGSATTDGGLGIAHALGYRFYDQQGKELLPTGRQLINLDRIDNSQVHPRLGKVEVRVICDVENPLTGPQGAAYVYGPQKGATPAQVLHLDRGLAHLATCLTQQGYPDVHHLAGAGAAGGVGGGAVALLGGRLVSGTTTFLELSHFEDKLQQADLLITGEGKLDSQTQQGKLISGVCKMAQQHAKPIIAVCGVAEEGVGQALGLQQVYTVLERCASLEEAIDNAAAVLTEIGTEMVW